MTTSKMEPTTLTESTCYRHPNSQTGLSCNGCGRYICSRCARLTSVGYKCDVCLNRLQGRFFNGRWWDYLIAASITLPLSIVTAFLFTYLLGNIGWFSWYLAFLASPVVAKFIVAAVRWGVRRRRSRHLAFVVAGCFIMVTTTFILAVLVMAGLRGDFFNGLFSLVEPGILLIVGTGTILQQLR